MGKSSIEKIKVNELDDYYLWHMLLCDNKQCYIYIRYSDVDNFNLASSHNDYIHTKLKPNCCLAIDATITNWDIAEVFIKAGFMPPISVCQLELSYERANTTRGKKILSGCLKSTFASEQDSKYLRKRLKKMKESQK